MVNNEKPVRKPLAPRQDFRDQAIATHSTRLLQIAHQALEVSATANRIAQAAGEAAVKGTTLSIQPQIAFLTGAFVRITKDWGVIEMLQSQNIVSKVNRPKSSS